MKKILTSSLFLLVFSLAAQATPSWATLNTLAAGADTSGGNNSSMYTAYYLTTADAEAKFGGSDVSSIESYLSQQFTRIVPEGGKAFSDSYYYGGQYTLDSYVGSGYTSADYVAIAFYGETEYRVFGAGSADLVNGRLIFDDGGVAMATATVGAWTAVPEPTSALLLLLGIAGLSLKRKRI